MNLGIGSYFKLCILYNMLEEKTGEKMDRCHRRSDFKEYGEERVMTEIQIEKGK